MAELLSIMVEAAPVMLDEPVFCGRSRPPRMVKIDMKGREATRESNGSYSAGEVSRRIVTLRFRWGGIGIETGTTLRTRIEHRGGAEAFNKLYERSQAKP